MPAVDYFLHREVAEAVARRRVKRGREWLFKHGLVLYQPTLSFLLSHGFVSDEYVTEEMLTAAKTFWSERKPLPRIDPMTRIYAGIGWREGVRNRKSEPGRTLTHEELILGLY